VLVVGVVVVELVLAGRSLVVMVVAVTVVMVQEWLAVMEQQIPEAPVVAVDMTLQTVVPAALALLSLKYLTT
jgi:hypothetical protein